MSIGGASPAGTVQYDSAATSTFGAIRVGDGNDGAENSTLNQSAGTINATSVTTGTLKMARTTSSNAAARRGEYNLNGVTLKPTANNTDFMEGLTTAHIKAGGAKIDTNGRSITNDQALTPDAAGRTLTKEGAGTLTLSSLSNSYTGATLVSAGTLFVSGSLDSSVTVDGTYTLITGTLNSANLANLGLANAFDIDGGGGGRSANFQEGSLQLVVMPEPNAAALFGGLGTLLLLRRRK